MTSAMEEQVVSFLRRMSFLLSDGKEAKDRAHGALLKRTLIIFSEALALWPQVPRPQSIPS